MPERGNQINKTHKNAEFLKMTDDAQQLIIVIINVAGWVRTSDPIWMVVLERLLGRSNAAKTSYVNSGGMTGNSSVRLHIIAPSSITSLNPHQLTILFRESLV